MWAEFIETRVFGEGGRRGPGMVGESLRLGGREKNGTWGLAVSKDEELRWQCVTD